MTSLNMGVALVLSESNLDNTVKKSIGNYALGYIKDDTFIVKYIGRSDIDLNARLKQWVSKYKMFKYSYAKTIKEAFEKECRNYHDFGENKTLDNDIHPDRPTGKEWKCPVCDIYDE